MPAARAGIRALVASAMGMSLAVVGAANLRAADEPSTAPPYGQFPVASTGTEWMGELIDVDPINRRGLMRPGGDLAPDRYNRFLGQPFALLPYGMVYYRGAPAELRDVPLGTVLHGLFYIEQFGWFLDRLGEVRDAEGPLLDTTLVLYGSGMA